ncbi:MAG: copper resistance protein CopC [Actinomycetota bacterium]
MANPPDMSSIERPRRAARRGPLVSRALLLAVAVGVPGISACLGMAPALAHGNMHRTPQAPMYVTSDPQSGSTVSSAPSTVTVTFSQPLDSSSKLRVIDHCGERVDTGGSRINLNQISVSLHQMEPSGKFIVLYTAVGPQGLTGATTNGFTFTATSGMACGMKMNMGGGSNMHGGGHMGGGDMGGMGSGDGSHAGMSMGDNMTMPTSHGGSTNMNGMTMSHDRSTGHHGMKGMGGMNDMHMGGHRRPPPSASGALPAFDLRPDGTMALVALALAGALGGLGGIALRLSG